MNDSNAKPMMEEEKTVYQVNQFIDELNYNLDVLIEDVNSLEGRLISVLKNTKQDEFVTKEPPEVVPLAHIIRTMAFRVSDIDFRIKKIIDRLEIK